MNIKVLALATSTLLLTILSCKKKEEKQTVTPQLQIEAVEFKFLDSLKANTSVAIDFNNTPSSIYFKAKFDKSITWKLTITGDTSGATKTFIGTSSQLDSTNTLWDGRQDSLYYFTQETCKVTLTDYNPVSPSTSTHSNSTTINITRPKALQENAVSIFDIKRINGRRGAYILAYDSETCADLMNVEASPDVFINGAIITCLSKEFLPFSKRGGPIQRFYKPTAAGTPINSPYYFILKGTDSYNNDFNIGHMDLFRSVSAYNLLLNSNENIKPQDLWFNVFVYGTGDGSWLNYVIKEDDDSDGQFNQGRTRECGYTQDDVERLIKYDDSTHIRGTMDDAFLYPILMSHKGWKLVSIPYSEFIQVPIDGVNSNGKGEHNPSKIYSVQFSLVASETGKHAQAIFDYPVLSIGGPLKY